MGYAIALLQRRKDVVIAPNTLTTPRITKYGNGKGWPDVQQLPCRCTSVARNVQVQTPG